MVEFIDASIIDLARSTLFLHKIKPSLKDKYVFGIEKIRPKDRSIVFHLSYAKSKDTDQDLKEAEIFILSAEYILEHPIWKGTGYDGSD
jgi:hypothetical protein